MVDRQYKLKHGKNTLQFTHRIVRALKKYGSMPANQIREILLDQRKTIGSKYKTQPTIQQVANILSKNPAFKCIGEVRIQTTRDKRIARLWGLNHEYLERVKTTDST